MPSFYFLLALVTAFASAAAAFVPSRDTSHRGSQTVLHGQQATHQEAVNRRSFVLGGILTTTATTLIGSNQPALAAAASDDKEKILQGYKRLNYLLDNWEKETTYCGTEVDPYSGQKKCERTPLKVMEYMGYKSMNDPLFKADKTLRRLESLAPPAREADYFDAVESWAQTAEEASGMAYTSSWAGPQNPNGGDDSIEYYLERAKQQVIRARNILKDVIDILQL